MKLSIDFWEVISLMLSFVGLMFAAGKLLLAQIEKRLNERFESLENARRESETNWSKLDFVPSFRCIMSAEKIIFVARQY